MWVSLSRTTCCVNVYPSRWIDQAFSTNKRHVFGFLSCPVCTKRKQVVCLSMKGTAGEVNVDSRSSEAQIYSSSADPIASRRDEDWQKVLELQQSGDLDIVKIEGCNNGGLLVRFGSISGFLPFSQLSSNRSPTDGRTMVDLGKDLIGQTLLVKILEASKEERRLIVSEKKAVWLQSVQQLKEGDVFEGRVNCVTDFGAFVDLCFPDGSYPVTGLVHLSEMSWDKVYDPSDLVREGENIKVKVINVDLERMRLALSIKQLETDPLLETLETIMPQESSMDNDVNYDFENIAEPLPGLADICVELLKEDGIDEVIPGRMAVEKRVVSQDLQLWLSNTPVEDGSFTLLARAGRQVQEVQVKTTLDKEGIKAAVQRVTGRVP